MSKIIKLGTANSPEQVFYTDSMRVFADKFNELVAYTNLGEVSSSLAQYIQEIVDEINSTIADIQATGIPKLVSYQYSLPVIADGQTDFTVPLQTFDALTDTVVVLRNGRVVEPKDYTIEGAIISLNDPIVNMKTTDMAIIILKNVPIGPSGVVDANTALQNESVTEIKLAPESVGEAKLKNGSVTSIKLAPKSVTSEKLSDAINNKLNYLNTTTTLYVDVNAGSDTNPGTADAPFKTMGKSAEVLRNRVGGNARVIVKEGIYEEKQVSYDNFIGKLSIEGVGNVVMAPIIDKGDNWKSVLVFLNVLSVSVSNITIAPKTGTAEAGAPIYLLSFSHVKSFNVSSTVNLVGDSVSTLTTFGCLTFHSTGLFSGGVSDIMYATTADEFGQLIIDKAYFNNCLVMRALKGGAISVTELRSGSQVLTIDTWTDMEQVGAGLDVNKVSTGIIIESGSNANGSYIKYANGILECYMTYNSWSLPVRLSNGEARYTFVYPYEFVTVPATSVSGLPVDDNGTTGSTLGKNMFAYTTSVESLTIQFTNDGTYPLDRVSMLSYRAIGRWK